MENIIIYELKNELNESKLLGPNNASLSFIESLFNIKIIISQAKINIQSNHLDLKDKIISFFSFLEEMLKENIPLTDREINIIYQCLENGTLDNLHKIYFEKEPILTLNSGKTIYPKTINQAYYIKELSRNDIVFAVGPAGTGKTYLAVLYAVSQLKKQIIKKIVLVRPVVEAGEKLGFLPGDLKEKIDPYLIPLYDALEDCFGKEGLDRYLSKGIIEVAPLAYMRGRTLDNALIILDEAQNATAMQMKMFLTRLGFNSQMIVTGDLTQIDLPQKNSSGLLEAVHILKNINKINIIEFTKMDVMRHPLVFKIIERYENKSLDGNYEN